MKLFALLSLMGLSTIALAQSSKELSLVNQKIEDIRQDYQDRYVCYYNQSCVEEVDKKLLKDCLELKKLSTTVKDVKAIQSASYELGKSCDKVFIRNKML